MGREGKVYSLNTNKAVNEHPYQKIICTQSHYSNFALQVGITKISWHFPNSFFYNVDDINRINKAM